MNVIEGEKKNHFFDLLSMLTENLHPLLGTSITWRESGGYLGRNKSFPITMNMTPHDCLHMTFCPIPSNGNADYQMLAWHESKVTLFKFLRQLQQEILYA